MGNELPASVNFTFCKELPASLNFDLAVDPCGGEAPIPVEGIFSAAVRVVFDAIGGPGIDGTLNSSILPTFDSTGVIGAVGNFSAEIQLADFDADGEWDVNVFRGLIHQACVAYEAGARVDQAKILGWEFSDSLRVQKDLVFSDGQNLNIKKCAIFKQFNKLRSWLDLIWKEGNPSYGQVHAPYVYAYPKHILSSYLYAPTTPLPRRVCGGYVYAAPRYREQCYLFENAKKLPQSWTSQFAVATRKGVLLCSPFEWAKLVEWKWPPPPPEEIIPPDPPGDFITDPDFDLHCLLPDPIWSPVLFSLSEENVCDRARTPWWIPPGSIPVKEVYIIVNTAVLFRVSDGAEINTTKINVSADADSWCWTFSATIAKTDLELVTPGAGGAVEIEIQINAIKFRMIVEGWSENAQFGSNSVSIKGRSLSAGLAKPYAATRDYVTTNDASSRQLVEQELTRPEGAGWGLTWDLADWQVPAGAFTYTNGTPLSAMSQVLNSVGGILQTDPFLKVLQAFSRYKIMPWNWAAADASEIDLTLPTSLILRSSAEWAEQPLYNGIYVSGTKFGVVGAATVDGTSGAFLHPPVTDPLITESGAVRERAKAELGTGGKKENIQLELPMLPEIGLVTPGTFIEVYKAGDATDKWRGVVRDVGIDTTRTGSFQKSNITIAQTIGVEKYHG